MEKNGQLSRARPGVRRPATFAIAGMAWWAATVALLHLLKPETGIAGHAMSEYALGRYGSLMTVAFVTIAAGQLAFAVALSRGVRPSGRAAPALFAIAGIESVLEAVFQADGTAKATTHGGLHVLFGVTSFVLSIIAMFLLVRRFRRDPAWADFARPTQLWALASIVSLFSVPALGPDKQGIGQRIFVPVLLGWVITTSLRLRRLDTAPNSGNRSAATRPEPVAQRVS